MIIRKGKSQVTFVYQPDNAVKEVCVVGSFNNWDPKQGKMTRQKDGTFRKRFQLPPGEHRYKFLVDGQWICDPEAERCVPNEFGSSDALITVG